jgi:hypothetical protein
MNIKKVINFVPNFNFGGVENSNINLNRELRNLGFDTELLFDVFSQDIKTSW